MKRKFFGIAGGLAVVLALGLVLAGCPTEGSGGEDGVVAWPLTFVFSELKGNNYYEKSGTWKRTEGYGSITFTNIYADSSFTKLREPATFSNIGTWNSLKSISGDTYTLAVTTHIGKTYNHTFTATVNNDILTIADTDLTGYGDSGDDSLNGTYTKVTK